MQSNWFRERAEYFDLALFEDLSVVSLEKKYKFYSPAKAAPYWEIIVPYTLRTVRGRNKTSGTVFPSTDLLAGE